MDHASECRKRAKDCIELTKKMSSTATPMLLTIAEAWTALAEQAELQESRQGLKGEANAPSVFRLQ